MEKDDVDNDDEYEYEIKKISAAYAKHKEIKEWHT